MMMSASIAFAFAFALACVVRRPDQIDESETKGCVQVYSSYPMCAKKKKKKNLSF